MAYPAYSSEIKRQALELYEEGHSFQVCGELLGISSHTVWEWTKSKGANRSGSETVLMKNDVTQIHSPPQIGEIRRGRYIGQATNLSSKYVWNQCIVCGKERWTRLINGKPEFERCLPCGHATKRGRPRKNRLFNASHGDGYALRYVPEHPRSHRGYVLEHIYVWETVNNKTLPKGWVIHHLNGVKNDNRPENLIALPSKKHCLVLQEKAKRIRALEVKIKLLEKAFESNQLIFKMEDN